MLPFVPCVAAILWNALDVLVSRSDWFSASVLSSSPWFGFQSTMIQREQCYFSFHWLLVLALLH
jgi:hypothetical protein